MKLSGNVALHVVRQYLG